MKKRLSNAKSWRKCYHARTDPGDSGDLRGLTLEIYLSLHASRRTDVQESEARRLRLAAGNNRASCNQERCNP